MQKEITITISSDDETSAGYGVYSVFATVPTADIMGKLIDENAPFSIEADEHTITLKVDGVIAATGQFAESTIY